MGVIAFPNLAPQGATTPSMIWGQRTISARNMSPLNGVATTLERVGSQWTARLPYENLGDGYGDARRSKLQTLAVSTRGYANRFYVPLYGWTRRGSFPATDLFTNSAFSSTTGWTADNCALTANDGVMRISPTAAIANVQFRQAVTLTQYAPYALRSLVIDGPQSSGLSLGPFLGAGNNAVSGFTTSRGMLTAVAVNDSAASQSQYPLIFNAASGYTFGTYAECGYSSLARCALVDNAPNTLLQSDTFQTTWSPSGATITANQQTSPDGTLTGDAVIENGATSVHSVSQAITVTSSAQDITFACSIQRSTRTFAAVELGTAGGSAIVYVNLTTGAISTAAAASGNWSNARGFVVSEGSDWFRLHLVARKTGSETSVSCTIYPANVSGTASYTGTNTATAVFLWRACAAPSGVPIRSRQTTTTASTGVSQTGGALHLKGLLASTNGLLAAGDPVEIITGTSTQMVRARTSLDSNAAGLGYFQFEAPIRVSPSDNAGVIVQNPLCRMMLDSPNVEWSEHSGGFSDLEFAAVEDTYP